MMKLDMGMGFWSSPWFDMLPPLFENNLHVATRALHATQIGIFQFQKNGMMIFKSFYFQFNQFMQ